MFVFQDWFGNDLIGNVKIQTKTLHTNLGNIKFVWWHWALKKLSVVILYNSSNIAICKVICVSSLVFYLCLRKWKTGSVALLLLIRSKLIINQYDLWAFLHNFLFLLKDGIFILFSVDTACFLSLAQKSEVKVREVEQQDHKKRTVHSISLVESAAHNVIKRRIKLVVALDSKSIHSQFQILTLW